ncbi:MAG: hypothetical protein AB7T86_04955 [Xanthobacteraceae bacterium]
MKLDIHDEGGSFVPDDEFALCAGPEGALNLVVPDLPGDSPVNVAQRLLIAVAALSNDPEWVEYTLAVFDAGPRTRAHH